MKSSMKQGASCCTGRSETRYRRSFVPASTAALLLIVLLRGPAAGVNIWAEHFANLSNWTGSANALTLDGAVNHPSSSNGSAKHLGSTTTSYYMYRAAASRPFHTCLVTAYGRESEWGYYSACDQKFRTMLHFREATGTDANCIMSAGYNQSASYGDVYARNLGSGTINNYASMGKRNETNVCGGATWVQFRITVGDTQVDFFCDNATATDRSYSNTRSSESRTKGVGRVYLGQTVTCANDYWWDLVSLDANAPAAPTGMTGTATSTSQINWSASPAGADYYGFEVFDGSGNSKFVSSTTSRSTTFGWQEGSLTPNTAYSRYIKAWNGSLSTATATTASVYTLADVPTLNSNVATTAGSGWYNAASWPGFTNPQGFGTGGKVSKFKYKWSTNAFDSIAENEGSDWSSGAMSSTPGSDGVWYLYLRSYNGDNKGNGSTKLGPYNYDNTAPTPGAPQSTSASATSITVNFSNGSDATAGLDATSPYQISRVEGGGYTGSWGAGPALSDPLAGLSAGNTVTYTVKTRDKAGNEASAATITGRVPPVDTGNSAIFSTQASTLAPPGLYPNSGKVFASSNGVLYGFNSATPAQLWAPISTGGSVQGRMPVATLNSALTVLAGSQDGKIYARNAATGAEVWTHDIGSGYKATAKPAGALSRTVGAYTGDVVFAASDKNDTTNFLRAIRADTGATLWTYQPGNLGPIAGSPAVVVSGTGGTVLIASQTSGAETGRVAAVKIADGSEVWQSQIGSVTSSVGVKDDGTKVFAVTDGGSLYSLAVATGATDGGYPLAVGTQPIYGAPFHVPNQDAVLVSLNSDNAVKMVSLSGPSVSWAKSLTAPSASLEYRGKVYVGSSDGKLYELSIADGTESASRTIGYTVGDPVVDAINSVLYVGANDGRIYSFSLPF